jgi:hypothetical protein
MSSINNPLNIVFFPSLINATSFKMRFISVAAAFLTLLGSSSAWTRTRTEYGSPTTTGIGSIIVSPSL